MDPERLRGWGGTICEGVRNSAIRAGDHNFICNYMGFSQVDLSHKNYTSEIDTHVPVFVNGVFEEYDESQYFMKMNSKKHFLRLRKAEDNPRGLSGCHSHTTDLQLKSEFKHLFLFLFKGQEFLGSFRLSGQPIIKNSKKLCDNSD